MSAVAIAVADAIAVAMACNYPVRAYLGEYFKDDQDVLNFIDSIIS